MTLHETHRVLSDDSIAGASSLVVEGVPWPVAALYEAADSEAEEVTPIQITWHPERSVLVRYRVRASTGSLAGQNQIVVTVGDTPPGAVEMEGPSGRATAWVVPNDPMLPGLRPALDPSAVNGVLRNLGSSAEVDRIRLRSYRPGRRGVVEVTAGSVSFYLKVVRPSESEELHLKHRHLAGRMLVPDSLGFSRDLGVVVLQGLPGVDLRRIIRDGEVLPDATSVASLLEALPEPPETQRRRHRSDPVPRLIDLLQRLVPDLHGELADLGAALEIEERGLVPVHGDFHEAQILMAGPQPVGVIDVDSYGWGESSRDPATMLGHLSTLTQSLADPGPALALARELNVIWDRMVDPVALRKRTAVVVLGLATGPFRVQQPDWPELTRARVRMAERWARSASHLDKSP